MPIGKEARKETVILTPIPSEKLVRPPYSPPDAPNTFPTKSNDVKRLYRVGRANLFGASAWFFASGMALRVIANHDLIRQTGSNVPEATTIGIATSLFVWRGASLLVKGYRQASAARTLMRLDPENRIRQVPKPGVDLTIPADIRGDFIPAIRR